MARMTLRQKNVRLLLTAYERLKRSQLHRRWCRTPHQQPTDRGTDMDSDAMSTTSESSSLSDTTLDSFSSLSLSSLDSDPEQENEDSESHLWSACACHKSFNHLDSRFSPTKQPRGTRSLTLRVCKAISTLYSSRYHVSRKFGLGRPPSHLPLILSTYKDNKEFHPHFRQHLRIDPVTFDKILTKISANPLFMNQSRHPQMPIDYQLAITLYRFGHYGNAASVQRVAKWAGVGKGTVLIVTQRVMAAVLQSSFKDQAIQMPTPSEKEDAKQWVESRSGCPAWRDGWCFVDGTLIPLAFRPFWYGQSYFDRKCNYSLNIQVLPVPWHEKPS